MAITRSETEAGARVLTFLIADVRGYTAFTRERGDAAAARLATEFAALARDAVAARSGRVIELRGDEALAVFEDPAQAVRAAVELQAACAEASIVHPDTPLPVGIGIDVGEAVPVEDGFRGAALNMAARLCSTATAGQVVLRSVTADVIGAIDGVRFERRGTATLKGFDGHVDLIEATGEPATAAVSADRPAGGATDRRPPLELDASTALVGRDVEMQWLRGTWRRAGRGHGTVVFVAGPPGIGKTRLAAELASLAAGEGAGVRYAGAGGAAAANAAAAVREAAAADRPTLVVLDDLDSVARAAAQVLGQEWDAVVARPAMVLGLIRDSDASSELAPAVARADRLGDGVRALAPLDAAGVREVAREYAGGRGRAPARIDAPGVGRRAGPPCTSCCRRGPGTKPAAGWPPPRNGWPPAVTAGPPTWSSPTTSSSCASTGCPARTRSWPRRAPAPTRDSRRSTPATASCSSDASGWSASSPPEPWARASWGSSARRGAASPRSSPPA